MAPAPLTPLVTAHLESAARALLVAIRSGECQPTRFELHAFAFLLDEIGNNTLALAMMEAARRAPMPIDEA